MSLPNLPQFTHNERLFVSDPFDGNDSRIDSMHSPGIHEICLREFFGERVCFEGTDPIFDGPLILMAFSNRSGSNLLGEHLRSLPFLSGFLEQLNFDVVKKVSTKAEIDNFPDYLKYVTGGRSDYGFKASWDQIMMLLRFGIPQMYTGVKVIHSVRNDVLGQAISYWIAWQTRRWSSRQEGRDIDPIYDFQEIARLMQDTQDSVNRIALISTIFGFPRLVVEYGRVTRNPAGVMSRVADFLDQDLEEWRPSPPKLQQQATQINKDWRKRFLADARHSLLNE